VNISITLLMLCKKIMGAKKTPLLPFFRPIYKWKSKLSNSSKDRWRVIFCWGLCSINKIQKDQFRAYFFKVLTKEEHFQRNKNILIEGSYWRELAFHNLIFKSTTTPAYRWSRPTSRKNKWINGWQVQQEGGWCMSTWLN